MKRRNFLGLIAAGASIQFLPSVAAAEAAPLANKPILWTAEVLTVEMEKMFACRMGPAMAFFEVVRGTDKIVEVKPDLKTEYVRHDEFVLVQEPPVQEHDRFVYQTYGFAIQGGDAWEAEHKLARHFYDEFSKLDTKNLVWRRKPQFETQEVTEYGDTWMSHEAIDDRPDLLAKKPDNVELDFLTDNYRYVTRRYPLHKMTMRLVFTDRDAPPTGFARQEGAPLPRIA